jgi:glycosyltransferase involved in cell wall biosynthesis
VDDEDLPALYSAAALFAFPSLYEGFGHLLEAMACARPSSLQYVLADRSGGDAAWLIEPTSVDAIADAMRRIRGRRLAPATRPGRIPAGAGSRDKAASQLKKL